MYIFKKGHLASESPTCSRSLSTSLLKPNNYTQKMLVFVFPLQTKRERKRARKKKTFLLRYSFSICLKTSVNANALKQEYVFRHADDVTEVRVCFRPQHHVVHIRPAMSTSGPQSYREPASASNADLRSSFQPDWGWLIVAMWRLLNDIWIITLLSVYMVDWDPGLTMSSVELLERSLVLTMVPQ